MLYLRSSERSPKRILQLYNCTWLHHTLCTENEDEGETHIDPSNLAICDTLQLTSTSVELTTSLARAISKAIGLSNELEQFDRMRSTLKAHKKKGRKLNEQECEVHEELHTQLQAQVLNKKELKCSVKAYEAQFYDKSQTTT